MNQEEKIKVVHDILVASNQVGVTDEEIRNMWNEYIRAARGSCPTEQSIQTVDEIWRNIYDNQ